MEVCQVGAHIGAEIRGVDPRKMEDDAFAEVRAALIEHQVVFFRGTQLTDDDHLALASRFGTPSLFPLQRVLGDAEPRITAIQDGPESPPGADGWHTDVTWTPEPPMFAFLRAILIPLAGGDTLWGSMTAAYEALSPVMRRMIDGLEVHHDAEGFVAAVEAKMGEAQAKKLDLAARLYERYPGVDHPLVRTHPETGKRALLWGGSFMKGVVGMTESESEALLGFLGRHIESPHFHCRWRWRAGDVAIWDERSTVHRALGDHFPAKREVRRTTVDGDKPFFRH